MSSLKPRNLAITSAMSLPASTFTTPKRSKAPYSKTSILASLQTKAKHLQPINTKALKAPISMNNLKPNVPELALTGNFTHRPSASIDSPYNLQKTQLSARPSKRIPAALDTNKINSPRISVININTVGLVSPASNMKTEENESGATTNSRRKTLVPPGTPGYHLPTISTHKKMSIRVQTNLNERNFDFSKPRSSLVGSYSGFREDDGTTPMLKSPSAISKESRSPLSGKKAKLELYGATMRGSLRRKSGFCHIKTVPPKQQHQQLTQTGSDSEEEKSLELVKIEGHKMSISKKRVSSILTKELEARYGVKLIDSEVSDSESGSGIYTAKDGSARLPSNKNFFLPDDVIAEKQRKRSSVQKSDFGNSRSVVTDEENSDDNISVTDSVNKRSSPDSPSRASFDNGLGGRSVSLEPNRGETIKPSRFYKNSKTIIATIGNNHTNIVQPEYMKSTGSMCFTELWSHKSNKRFTRVMKGEAEFIKVNDDKGKRQFESVYRPSKWRNEEMIKDKIKRKDHDLALSVNPHRESVAPMEKESLTAMNTPKNLANSKIVSLASSRLPRSLGFEEHLPLINSARSTRIESPERIFKVEKKRPEKSEFAKLKERATKDWKPFEIVGSILKNTEKKPKKVEEGNTTSRVWRPKLIKNEKSSNQNLMQFSLNLKAYGTIV